MTQTYRQNLNVAWRRVRGKDSAILVLPLNSNVFGLSEVATRVWEIIEDWHTVDSVIDVIVEEFDAPRDEILADVEVLLADLMQRDLVERQE